jgi:hypothetical protein
MVSNTRMAVRMRTTKVRTAQLLTVLAVTMLGAAGVVAQTTFPTATHPAVGSWFGKAMQLCPQNVAPSACSGGNPAIALYMTPTLTADGDFLGNDSLTLGAPPFGPHTTAHGQWVATSATGFTADYTFMLNAYPPHGDNAIQGLRFRWVGNVVDKNTIQGYVNMIFSDPILPTWSALINDEFPSLPSQVTPLITAPTTFIKDPTLCMTTGCPLVFKFTIKRVTP